MGTERGVLSDAFQVGPRTCSWRKESIRGLVWSPCSSAFQLHSEQMRHLCFLSMSNGVRRSETDSLNADGRIPRGSAPCLPSKWEVQFHALKLDGWGKRLQFEFL